VSMTSPEPESTESPTSLQEEAGEPAQDAMADQRDAVGDEPQPGDVGGHS
jgi:hypothetical protein